MLRRRRRRALIGAAALACLVAVAVLIVRFLFYVGVIRPTYVQNVFVNGASFAGYAKEDGVVRARELEDEWLSASFTLTYLDRTWTFSRASVDADIDYESQMEMAWNFGHVGSVIERKRVVDALARNPIYLDSAITYDEAKLDTFIDSVAAEIDVAAVDAVVVPGADAPIVLSEAKTGLAVNKEQFRTQLISMIETGDGDTTIPVETQFPSVQSDDVSFQTIAEFQTDVSFRNNSSRSNVRLALSNYNGMTVSPGESVSFNTVVGNRTTDRGYKEATEYAGDQSTLGVGGGVCQASTTLYNAVIRAGMTIVERWSHSMTVSYVEPSMDAAVSENSKDFIFRNDTEYPIYIYTSVTNDYATVTVYGHRPEYRYVLESVIVRESLPATRNVFIDDIEGKHAFYTDEYALQSEGKPGCVSQGWLVSYDWDTDAEVTRVQVNQDSYRPGANTYYRGVHSREDDSIVLP